MKKIFFAVCFAFAALNVNAQDDEYRQAVAIMLESSGGFENAKASMTEVANYYAANDDGQSAEFWQIFTERAIERLKERMTDICAPIYHKHLTLEDINHLSELYRNPVMQKFIAAIPAITQEAFAAGSVLGQEVANEVLTEMMSATGTEEQAESDLRLQ